MAGLVPALRHGDRLPRLLVELAGAVGGVVPSTEVPWPGEGVDGVAAHERGRHIALECRAAHGARGNGRDRQHALEQRRALGGELRQVVREQRESTRHRDDRRPSARFGRRERWADEEAVGIVEPRPALVEAASCRSARGGLGARPRWARVGADPHAVHEPYGVLQGRAAAQQEGLGAQAVAQRRQRRAVRFGMSESAVVCRPDRGAVEGVDREAVVPPVPHDLAGQLGEPLLHLGVRPIQRVQLAPPGLTHAPRDGSARQVAQQPVGVRGGHPRALGDGERRDP